MKENVFFVDCLLVAAQYISCDDHFNDVGLALGFRNHQLESIRTDCRTSITDASFQMLSQWQQSCIMQGHVNSRKMLIGLLIQAFKQAHLESVAQEIF